MLAWGCRTRYRTRYRENVCPVSCTISKVCVEAATAAKRSLLLSACCLPPAVTHSCVCVVAAAAVLKKIPVELGAGKTKVIRKRGAAGVQRRVETPRLLTHKQPLGTHPHHIHTHATPPHCNISHLRITLDTCHTLSRHTIYMPAGVPV